GRTGGLSGGGVPLPLPACSETTDPCDSVGSAGGGGAAMSVGTTYKVTALDPAAAYDNGSSTVWTQCYSYLMNTSIGSEDGVPEPDLAETADFTSDNVFTVTLKEGLTFANGHDLTSEDVKHTFDRQLAIADANGPSSLLGNLDKVEVVDDLTVEFDLKEPGDQTFPYVLCSPAGPIDDAEVFPADAILPDADIVEAKAFRGPYSITSWKINELVTFEAFADYKGLFDAPATAQVSMSYYADLQKDDAVTVHDGPGGEIRYIVFNFHTNPYGEKTEDPDPKKARAVRQAVADLLDRQAIATSVYTDTYTPLFSYIPEGLPGSGTQFKDMYGDG